MLIWSRENCKEQSYHFANLNKFCGQITWCKVVSFASVIRVVTNLLVVNAYTRVEKNKNVIHRPLKLDKLGFQPTLITAAKETRCKDIYRFVHHPWWGHSRVV